MPSDLRRPELPDTPDFFARVEAEIVQEAARIKARRVGRQRRAGWYETLRPVLTAGAAFAVLVVLFPLANTGPADAPLAPPAISDTVDVGQPVVVVTELSEPHIERLPRQDVAAMEDDGSSDSSGTDSGPVWPGRVA